MGGVTGFRYKNVGVHDVFVNDQDFFFGDSFGVGVPDQGGALICSTGAFSNVFSQSPGWVVRGIGGDPQGELLVGHSHKGERRKRFKGDGALLLFNKGEFVREMGMPHWAQTYQVMQTDGTFVQCAQGREPLTADAVLEKLHGLLGEPVYQHAVKTDPVKLKA